MGSPSGARQKLVATVQLAQAGSTDTAVPKTTVFGAEDLKLIDSMGSCGAPMDLISCLVNDELSRVSGRLLERRRQQAAFRDPLKTLDNFDTCGGAKESSPLKFNNPQISSRAWTAGPHSRPTLRGALLVGSGGRRLFPGGRCLSEPLVHSGGSR